jgi:peptidoglycan/LPS O-acetylase OafA/YrhL
MPYRKDIDGLRAIAVLGVIFYHSEILIGNKFFLSGGFLGVDVFFVISGYLITSIIYQENKNKKTFSFLNFYERRIRRLLPALLVVLSFSLFFAYFLLLPVQFKAYINSVISSIFFYSNIYFHYSGQAYGEAILSSKPLLHTWSLAVEEQFYILYPIFFIFFINFLKDKIKYLFYLIILTSVLFASIINENHASFNFYMIITRAWELLIGGLIALKHINKKKNKRK